MTCSLPNLPKVLLRTLILISLWPLNAGAQTPLSKQVRNASPASFAMAQKLGNRLGEQVAIRGGYALLSEPASGIEPGAVYVLHRDDSGTWGMQDTLSSDDVESDFGEAIAVSEAYAFVGAPSEGKVYVYERDGATWAQVNQLEGDSGDNSKDFGHAVALHGERALVGAFREEAAYIFERGDGGAWTRTDRLTASDGEEGDWFGWSVALSEERALIGSIFDDQGSAYVFEEASGAWKEETHLTGSGVSLFGWSVAVGGGHALVGARYGDAVHVFHRSGDGGEGWKQQKRLSSGDGSTRFGNTVSLDAAAGRALIGAPTSGSSGAAYVYERAGAGWSETARLTSPQHDTRTQFGYAAALDGQQAVVGASRAQNETGRAFFFEQADGAWMVQRSFAGTTSGLAPITGRRVPCTGGTAHGYACEGVDLLSFLPVSGLGGAQGAKVNEIWGWTDPRDGTEYVLVGRTDGVGFVDVSDPLNPVYLGNLPTHTFATIWRDVKVYADHAFIVADGAGDHGMQVFDLRQLRDVENPPLVFEETAHYGRFGSAHNVAVDTATGFAYALGIRGTQAIPSSYDNAGECGPGLHIIDIQNPEEPKFAGCFADEGTGRSNDGYTHDAQCVIYDGPDADYQGREVCFGANENALSIADVTDKDDPQAVAAATYPKTGYTHQGWLTEDQRYFVLGDELDERNGRVSSTRTLVFDVIDLDDPLVETQFFNSTSSIDHNLYVKGDSVYQSNYTSGLRILDASDASAPREVGYFDTVPASNATTFGGSWGNYPFFESGIVAVGSREYGLYLVEPNSASVTTESAPSAPSGFALSPPVPNPFTGRTRFTVDLPEAEAVVRVDVYDVLGRRVRTLHDGPLPAGETPLALESEGLPAGTYFVRATVSDGAVETQSVTLVR